MFKYLSKFWYLFGNKPKKLLLLLFAALLVSCLETIGIGLVGPFMALVTSSNAIENNVLLNKIYQQLNLNSQNTFISILGLLIIFIFYVKSGLRFYLQRAIFRFGYDQQGELRLRLLKTYLQLPYTFHLRNNTALFIQNIIEETKSVANGILITFLNGAAHLFILCALFLLLVSTDVLSMVVILTVILTVFFIYKSFRRKLAFWGKEASLSSTEAIRIVNHSLGGLKETRVIGCESYFISQMREQAQRYAISMSSALSFRIVPLVIIESLIITFLIGLVSLSLIFGRDSQQLISVLSIFTIAAVRIIPSGNQVTSAIMSLKNSSFAFNKLYHDLREIDRLNVDNSSNFLPARNLDKTITNQDVVKKPLQFKNQIVLDQVAYNYPNASEAALTGISLTIKKGQSIALIGKSGAGKTTLVDVILGLLTPERGDIRVDNTSVYQDLRSWHNLVGYIPQSIFLLDETIEKNIAFGVPEHLIDPIQLNNAIEAAQLQELVEQLPEGVKTKVGERGVRLSGGQRQRVGIARALYHEREILVLDEATAALDNETESKVTEAIKSLSGLKTMIIIAHRLTTVKHCDRLYVIERGRIVKSGSYQEVVLNT